MRYEGNIFRPPSEAYSLILQVTIGCSHNKCTFCSMFKDKRFRVRDVSEVIEDLEVARGRYRRVERIFLADGDVMALNNAKLMVILKKIRELFPECERVNVYGSAKEILKRTPQELKELKENGVQIIYIGAESGSEKVLKAVHKGYTRAQLIEAVRKIEDSGIMASVTFISGLGGRELLQEHAVETGTMISEMEPSYVGLLTLMKDRNAPLFADIESGKFQVLTPEEVVAESLIMMENINIKNKTCVFRSNHASNYISLRGNLPQDKEKMMKQLEKAASDTGMLKDERFRAL